MPKSKYVLIGLLWLLRCPFSPSYTANTSASTGLLMAKSCAKKSKSEHEHLSTDSATDKEAPVQESDDTIVAPDQPPRPEGDESLIESTDPKESHSDGNTQDAIPPAPEGPIKSIIQYDAEESIVFDIKNKTIRMYGGGVIEQDDIKLNAEEVFLNWTDHTITAFSKKNEEGAIEKKVVLQQAGVEYIAEDVRYNFDSQRAVANNLFHKQDDGILRADKIKKDRKDTFYADKGRYTTCNCTSPCFHISAKKLKMTQDDQIVSGPFQFYFDNVPTPLGFPTGIFYFPGNSGIILPEYGGESARGFCLKDGGYYIKFNDYVNLALQGDIYSKGSTRFAAKSLYKKRYQYNGRLSYERRTNIYPSERHAGDRTKSWRFRWAHATENNRASDLTADVNLENSSFRKQDALSSDEKLQANIDSSIRYTNKLVGLPYTFTVNLLYRTRNPLYSNKGDGQKITATIPSISLPTKNIYPFRQKGRPADHWYSNIYFQHKFYFKNELSNFIEDKRVSFSPNNWPLIFKNGNYGAKNEFPIRSNIKLLSYLNLTPVFRYRERWYWERLHYKDPEDNKGEKIKGFKSVRDCDFGTELATTLYGTYTFSRNAAVQAIRHELEPFVSFTYVPDFSASKYGYWQTMADGKKKNRFKNAIYGAPADRRVAKLNVRLNNRLEMKVKNRPGSERSTQKISILKSFNWRTGYDFLKDEFPLEDITFYTATSLFNRLIDISFDSTFDPYIYRKNSNTPNEAVKINEFAWKHGQGLGRVKTASLNISTKFKPGGKDSILEKYRELEEEEEDIVEEEVKEELKHIQEHPEQYVDLKIPWSLDVGYEWDYKSPLQKKNRYLEEDNIYEWPDRSLLSKEKKPATQQLSLTGNIKLTKNWKVVLKTRYNITEKKFMEGDRTQISIHRDLHCWDMDFSWNPLGDKQHYSFSIRIKSPLLKALKYSRTKDYRNF